jgi:hypothetical protein
MDATMLAAVCIGTDPLRPGMSKVIVNIEEQLIVGG